MDFRARGEAGELYGRDGVKGPEKWREEGNLVRAISCAKGQGTVRVYELQKEKRGTDRAKARVRVLMIFDFLNQPSESPPL